MVAEAPESSDAAEATHDWEPVNAVAAIPEGGSPAGEPTDTLIEGEETAQVQEPSEETASGIESEGTGSAIVPVGILDP